MSESGMAVLWSRCASSRDEGDWERLVGVLRPKVRSAVIAGYMELEIRPVWEQVEERIQDVYCRLLDHDCRALRSFRGSCDGEVVAYLRRVGRSVVVDRVRKLQASKRGGGWHPVSGSQTLDLSQAERIADPGPSPDERYIIKEWRRSLVRQCAQALAGCAERDRRIFRMAHFEGLSSREIAAELGGQIDPGSVDSVLYRQRRLLARRGLSLPHRRAVRK